MHRIFVTRLALALVMLLAIFLLTAAVAQTRTVTPGLAMTSIVTSAGKGLSSAEKSSGDTQSYVPLHYPGSTYTVAYGINNLGDIVGTYVRDGAQSGFIYSQGKYAKIAPAGCSYTLAQGINDEQEIVGWCGSIAQGQTLGFTLQSGVLTTFSYPGSMNTYASGVNNQGDVVGAYEDDNGQQHGFLYSGGVFIDIDPPGSRITFAAGINSAGEIVGAYTPGGGFTYSDGIYTDVNYPGALGTQIFGVNKEGDLVGNWDSTSGGEEDLAYNPSSQEFIGFNFRDSKDSSANGINDSCSIVGFFTVGTTFYGYYVPRKSCPQ